MTRRMMDMLTVYAWLSQLPLACLLALVHGYPDAARPAVPPQEPTSWQLVGYITLAVLALLFGLSGVASWVAHWLAVVAFLWHRGKWGWLIVCFVFNVVGSTIAYLVVRDHWVGFRSNSPNSL